MRAQARALAVVQARMSSTRLPGKVLEDLGGATVLERVLERLGRCRELQAVVVATSEHESDDAIAATASVPVVRGALDDVLDRYRLAVSEHPCEAVVRITADCPLIDPEIVDRVVARWRQGAEAYVANVIEPRTFPKGMDTEVITASALVEAAAEATDPHDREHVTPFIRDRPERFPQAAVTHEPPLGHLRMTLDTPEDLAVLRDLVARTGPGAGLDELVEALDP
jgi:spore coat polysaccharide biosynthesis protein SpsF